VIDIINFLDVVLKHCLVSMQLEMQIIVPTHKEEFLHYVQRKIELLHYVNDHYDLTYELSVQLNI